MKTIKQIADELQLDKQTVSGTPDVDDVSGIILNNNGEQVFRLESHSIKNVETYNNHKEYIITTDTNRELSAWLA